MNKSYQHDMHGAIMNGYVRRTREACRRAMKESAGWMSPYYPTKVTPYKQFRMTLGTMLEEARRLGVTEEEIQDELERHKTTGDFGCPSADRDRRLARPNRPYTEDPSHAEWDEYDAFIDGLKERELRDALRAEARLRASAQREAGIS